MQVKRWNEWRLNSFWSNVNNTKENQILTLYFGGDHIPAFLSFICLFPPLLLLLSLWVVLSLPLSESSTLLFYSSPCFCRWLIKTVQRETGDLFLQPAVWLTFFFFFWLFLSCSSLFFVSLFHIFPPAAITSCLSIPPSSLLPPFLLPPTCIITTCPFPVSPGCVGIKKRVCCHMKTTIDQIWTR